MFKQELYDFQKFERIETEAGRRYRTPTGNVYPSVTTVIGEMTDKTFLKEWQNRIGIEEANRVSKRATNRGNKLHKLCEDYLQNKEVELKNPMFDLSTEMFQSIKPILDKNITAVHGIEFPLYSDRFKTAGTCDLLCSWNHELSILDFKGSSKPKREDWIENYFIQETVYTACLFEIYGLKAKNIITVIAVEHDKPQIFVKDPMDYMPRALQMFKDYHSGN